jgi:lysophospholipase L1-like esterase
MRRLVAIAALPFLLALGRAAPITVYLAGDSTMADKLPTKRPETGWGEMLQQYFSPAAVRIDNRAQNGRSTRTFIAEGRWQGIVDAITPGDYVFIQFGHNDEATEYPDRYTPPADYRANLLRMVNDVRARRGLPVLLTPVRRRKFDSAGQLVDTHGVYPDIVRAIAADEHVPLIDMHKKTAVLLSRFGADSSRALFNQLPPNINPNYPAGIDDNTHFRPRGAELVAAEAVQGIRELNTGLEKYLIAPVHSGARPIRENKTARR